MPLLSVVVPAFNEEEGIGRFHARLDPVLRGLGLDCEVVFVNDGSSDSTLEKLSALRESDPRVRILDFSRNFGHQIAITAGLDYAAGDAVIVMDSDLQDPPEVIPEMVARWREGSDIVYALRASRESDTAFKLWTAKAFYRVIRALTKVDIPADAGDFRLMSRRAVEQLKSMRERHRFVRGMASWIGFRQAKVYYKREARVAGETKYPLSKMLRFAMDAIVSFSDKPLRWATFLGFTVSAASCVATLYFLAYKLFPLPQLLGLPPLPPGITAQLVATFFLGGVQLLSLGIIGEYVGRIYEEAKRRPLYIVADEIGFDREGAPGDGARVGLNRERRRP